MSQAQFVIDIATQIAGADKTSSELDDLARKLTSAGATVDDFERATVELRQGLAVAAEAAKAANAALSDGETRYKQAEVAANRLAKATEKAALANGGIVPVELFNDLERAKQALNEETEALSKLQRAAGDAAQAEKRFGVQLADVNKLQRAASASLGEGLGNNLGKVKGALGDLGGPLGSIGEKLLYPIEGFNDLSESLGRSRAIAIASVVGIVAVAAAVVALGVAAVAGLAKVTAWGVGLADQARSAALTQAAFERLNPELAGLGAQFGQLTNETGVSSDRLREIAKDLQGAKVAAEDMPAALRAAATAEAALGQGGASEFVNQVKEGKRAVGELSAEMQATFGDIAQKRMLSLSAQSERFGRVVGETFGGLNIDPLLSGLSVLVDLFDQNTTAGKAFAFLFEAVFQPVVDIITAAIPLVEGFVLGMLIGFTKIYIAIKPVIASVKEILGFNDPATAETFDAVKVAGEALAKIIGVVVAVLAGVIGIAAAVVIGIGKIAFAFAEVGLAVWGFINDATKALTGFSLVDIGIQMIAGLASGITSTASLVVDALVGTVKGAVKAATDFLGISSPSKLLRTKGRFTGEGYALGVEDEADTAHEALAKLVSLPPENDNGRELADLARPAIQRVRLNAEREEGAIKSRRAGGTAGGQPPPLSPAAGAASIDLAGATFNFYGVKDGEQAVSMLRDALVGIIEGEVIQSGGTPELEEEAA
jgi:hypothetical protein